MHNKRTILAFVGGCLLASAILIPVAYFLQLAKYEYGRDQGVADALEYSIKELSQEFGGINPEQSFETLYSYKSNQVVIVDVDGVKTVRVGP